jgi:hypothetical protein
MQSQQIISTGSSDALFENVKPLLTPQEVATILGLSPKTIYDWKYRSILRKVPIGLFIKFNRKLFIRTEILRGWILSQN